MEGVAAGVAAAMVDEVVEAEAGDEDGVVVVEAEVDVVVLVEEEAVMAVEEVDRALKALVVPALHNSSF